MLFFHSLALFVLGLVALALAAAPPTPNPNAFPLRLPVPAIAANARLPVPGSFSPDDNQRVRARGLFGHAVGGGAILSERSEAEALEERGAWEAVRTGQRMEKRVKKRGCAYVGTFFKLIDCNAPKDSTDVPYAPAPTPSAP